MSLGELKRSGFTIRTEEALAIVQELMHSHPACGPATIETVGVKQDGSILCRGDAPLSVTDAAAFLQSLLPLGPSQVPAALRYTVARALLEVDAPPFESLDELSAALARYEHHDRAQQLRELVQRAARHAMSGALFVERRRSAAPLAELRRQLRDADARIYDQQLALDALGAMVPAGPAARPPISRTLAISLTLAAGLILAGAGDVMRARASNAADDIRVEMPPPPVQAASHRIDTASPVSARVIEPDLLKLASKSSAPAVTRVRTRPQPQRSRFPWLRGKIVFRSEPLN